MALKARTDWEINGRTVRKGEVLPWYFIYPFFGVHMLMFGLSGFFMAYGTDSPDLVFLYLHGGLAITVYLVFYLVLFGLDQVRWMFINAALGLWGIYAQIDLVLRLFRRQASDFPPAVHVIPFLYYILYTFLLHQFVLDVTGARDNPGRRRVVDVAYVLGSVVVYGLVWLAAR